MHEYNKTLKIVNLTPRKKKVLPKRKDSLNDTGDIFNDWVEDQHKEDEAEKAIFLEKTDPVVVIKKSDY